MKELIRFRVRPKYRSEELLVEICADHRTDDFPSMNEILQEALHAKLLRHPDPKMHEFIKTDALMDHFISYWVYAGGSFEIDDDWCGLFVLPQENNSRVASDVEQALLGSGLFVKEEVNFADYA